MFVTDHLPKLERETYHCFCFFVFLSDITVSKDRHQDKLFKKIKYVSRLVSGSTQNHVALSSFMSLTMFYSPVVESCKNYILSLFILMLNMMAKKSPTHSSVTLVLIFPLNIDRKHPEPQLLASLYK